MPPVPVLVLIGLAGLVVYLLIGAAFGAFASAVLLKPKHIRALSERRYRGSLGSGGYASDAWIWFAVFTLLWPVVLVGMITFKVCQLVLLGPFWLVTHTASYVLDSMGDAK